MELSPEDRVSADEALAHPWFSADPAPTPSEEIPVKKISRRRGLHAKESGVKRERQEDTEDSPGREKRANTASPETKQDTSKDTCQHPSPDNSQLSSQHESQETSEDTSQHESQTKSQDSSQHQSTSSSSSSSSKGSKGKRGREEDSLEESEGHTDKKPALGGDQQQQGATDSDQDSIST